MIQLLQSIPSSNNKSREYKPSFLGKPSLYSRGFYFGLVPLLCLNLVLAGQYAWDDAQHALSSNHALGTWLQQHPAYNNAILMAEPDYIIESLPYYADNPLYLLREGRFGKTVSWTTASSQRMSLGQLLAAAQKIQHQEQRPVLIVLGHLDIDAAKKQTAGEKDYSYNKIFAWGAEDWLEFTSATQPIATFGDATSDENYEVYVLRPQ